MRIALLVLAMMAMGWPQAASATQDFCAPGPAWLYNSISDAAVTNRVEVGGAGDLRWNGARVSLGRLRHLLEANGRLPRPGPTILFLRHNSDCALVVRVRALITATMPCGPDLCAEVREQPALAGPPSTEEQSERRAADAMAALDEARREMCDALSPAERVGTDCKTPE